MRDKEKDAHDEAGNNEWPRPRRRWDGEATPPELFDERRNEDHEHDQRELIEVLK
jgi:hypothetical protein